MPKLKVKDKPKQVMYCKASQTRVENGMIMGYASTWDNVDAGGDIVRRGAFTKTIQERVATGKVPLMVVHMLFGGDTNETIGIITKAVEDEVGLWVEAELFEGQIAQETRDKVKIAPNLFGQSIGFKTIMSKVIVDEAGNETGGEELLEIMLVEVTVTARPANTETSAAAKTESVETKLSEIEQLKVDCAALSERVSAIQGTPIDTDLEEKAASKSADKHVTLDEIDRQRRVISLLEKSNEGNFGTDEST